MNHKDNRGHFVRNFAGDRTTKEEQAMTEEKKPKIALTYEERQALPIIQKLLKRKPEAFELLMKDMTKAAAVNVLLTAKKEMQDLHLMAQSMVAAAGIVVKMDQPKENEQ